MLKTTDEARDYFKPLTYEDVTESNFMRLVAILERRLGIWNEQVINHRNKFGQDNRYHMSLYHKKKRGTVYITDNRCKQPFKQAYIKVLCDNYSIREGISFNRDGFIGFAGWSDSDNVRPFIDAFEEWVDEIKKNKNTIKFGDVCIENPNWAIKEIKGYYVDEFPENPDMGRVVHKDNKDYLYNGQKWVELTRRETCL